MREGLEGGGRLLEDAIRMGCDDQCRDCMISGRERLAASKHERDARSRRWVVVTR